MTDNKKTSDSDDWETRQERKMVERFKIAAVMVVIIVLYNLLDPKHILLEYLSVLLYKFSVLWNQFVLLVQRNWLIYLIGLFSAWIVVTLLQKFFAALSFPKEGRQHSDYDIEPEFWEKWGGRIPGNLTVIFANLKSFLPAVIVIYVIFISILLNPIGKLINNFNFHLSKDLLHILNGVCGLAGLVVLWILISSIGGYFSKESRAHRDRPKFFEEMQETLRSILRPMGFEEKENPESLARGVTFSQDQLTVNLWFDYRDQIYFVDASSKYSLEEREKGMQEVLAKSKVGGEFDRMEYAKFHIKDFSVDGTILNADTFKSNAVSKLHRWLAEHNVGNGPEYLTTDNDEVGS